MNSSLSASSALLPWSAGACALSALASAPDLAQHGGLRLAKTGALVVPCERPPRVLAQQDEVHLRQTRQPPEAGCSWPCAHEPGALPMACNTQRQVMLHSPFNYKQG